jgi:hypothetical protein
MRRQLKIPFPGDQMGDEPEVVVGAIASSLAFGDLEEIGSRRG